MKNKHSHLPLYLLTVFWISQTISLFGDRLNNFSLAALINRFAENPSLTLSKLYLAMYLPIFVLAPLVGILLDKLDKRWVLVLTDIARGIIVLLIPFFFLRTGSFLPVFALVFILSTGNLFFLPAKSALIPELVPHDKLVKTNSVLWVAGIIGFIGGFLGGGLIFDYLSWPACFLLDGLTYFLSALLLAFVAFYSRGAGRQPVKRPNGSLSIFSALRESFTGIRNNPGILAPLGIQAMIFLAGGGFSVLGIVAIKAASPPGSSMGISAAGLSTGIGMGLGSILANHLPDSPISRKWIEIGLFGLFIPASAGMAIGGLSLLCLGGFIAGFVASPLIIISESELQRNISISMRGRIFAFREIVTKSVFLLSAFLFTSFQEFAGTAILLVVLGLFLALIGIYWIVFQSSRQ
ncbi:MAG: MFS transporter [Candidatus Krumholzibacteria bacterium]|nr:MFS transporter [Candidatus Krumholzibacteria bacterium]